jgi:alpha-beta hydrolase superfamily lysophospholipase
MARWRRVVAIGVVLTAVGGTAALAWRARVEAIRLVTNPMETRRLPGRTPIDAGIVYDDVSVTARDGTRLVGWHLPTTNGAVIIAQHGYKGDRGEMLNEAEMLHRRGFGVLVPALRAHDLSDGNVISFGRLELDDLARWYEFAVAQPGVDRRRVGLLGNSLGGTLALQFAARQPGVAAVAAQSAFSSLRDTINTSVRFFTGMSPFPFAPLITFWAEREAGISVDDVDAKQAIGRISPRPVLLMQGGADVVITVQSGQWLYEAAGEPKELWFEPDVGHARFDNARPDEYARRVGGFFEKYLTGS